MAAAQNKERAEACEGECWGGQKVREVDLFFVQVCSPHPFSFSQAVLAMHVSGGVEEEEGGRGRAVRKSLEENGVDKPRVCCVWSIAPCVAK